MSAAASSSSNCSRLCRLIDNSLHQFTVHHTYHSHSTSVSSLPKDKDKEKQILIALSEVLKQIQLWTPKLNAYHSHNVKDLESASCLGGCASHSDDDNHCLANIVAHLIVLLTLENQYIQHLAGNVLSFISEFVATSKTNWDGFIHLVCVCLELAINNTLSYPSAPSSSEAEDFNSDSSKFDDVIRPRLTNANWCTVAGIIRVLRNILKYLKREDDDQLLEVYLNSVDSCLSNVHWDLFEEVHVGQNSVTQKNFCADALFFRSISGCIDKHPIRYKIINLVPKVLYWCLGKEGDYVDTCISQYFRHKLLVLMIRLSFQTCLECSTLKALHFLYVFLMEKHICIQAIYRGLECCFRKKGLLELHKWLQGHFPTETFLDNEMYMERCVNFASSLLHLFMHEDDILFKMLLQLLGVPFCTEQQYHKEKGTFQDVKEDILFHVSNIFSPICLFHLFLSKLHYDHEVLLDYLISKDMGISCAEYLLRCLRIICDSWNLFVEFSFNGKVINQSSCKKRKVSFDGSNFGADVTPMLVKNNGIITSQEKEYTRDHRYGSQRYITEPFEEAKECLLSLRNSVESLHKKNLFPYNPKVLLKRLTRFQELCFK
ncbi:hypothetical protein CMV_019164 [Castanea mollissima]|uniref:Protein Lines C-terminal domain-containing protein n=1 Tax=Castanea mollissima TaxID=60419 RepID=A0A8J4VNY6_9ROSI|nr:hypothetical protein CMV_019164 [Castanea mollissima]